MSIDLQTLLPHVNKAWKYYIKFDYEGHSSCQGQGQRKRGYYHTSIYIIYKGGLSRNVARPTQANSAFHRSLRGR